MTDSYGNGFQAPRTKMPELADALDIAPCVTPGSHTEFQWWAPGWFIVRNTVTGETEFVRDYTRR